LSSEASQQLRGTFKKSEVEYASSARWNSLESSIYKYFGKKKRYEGSRFGGLGLDGRVIFKCISEVVNVWTGFHWLGIKSFFEQSNEVSGSVKALNCLNT
jgi:hypothetical protein